jgi:hypothetical protein
LVLTSLEIGKALADHGRLVFRAEGTCMYPCVRPGDVLHLESRTAEEITVGDIAVCRGPGYLFAHRTIAKDTCDGRPYIVTRPDGVELGSDGPTYDKDVLGIVTSIERKGKQIPTLPQQIPRLQRQVLAARLAAIKAARTARWRLLAALTRWQSASAYSTVAQLLLSPLRSRASYVVRLPFGSAHRSGVYRPVPPSEFDVSALTWQGRPVDRWTLAQHLGEQQQPSAYATFVLSPPFCPEPGWRVKDLYVRARYRGGGLDSALLDKAREILARAGSTLRYERV